MWEQEGASTGLRIFPRHYLAPRKFCEDNSENFVGPRKNNRTALGGTKNNSLGALKLCEHKKVTALADSRTKNRANARTPPEGSTRKLCHSWRVFEEFDGLRSTKQTAGRAAGSPASFVTFLSGKEKFDRSPLAKGKNFIKSSVCLPKKFSKNSFYLSNFPSGKNFIIFPLEVACLSRFCLYISKTWIGKVDFAQFPIA